jgi:hypothetical protein
VLDCVAKMNALISTLDLPKIKLSKAEQVQLDAQRQAQQTRLDDTKAQLEALKPAAVLPTSAVVSMLAVA